MRIYFVEETPEYDIFGAITSRFLDREEAEDYVWDLTLGAFTEGYNVDEHVIIEMMKNGYLISCGIYDVNATLIIIWKKQLDMLLVSMCLIFPILPTSVI